MNEFFDWVMYFMYSRFTVVVWNMQTWCCSTTGSVVRAWQNMHTFTLTATRKSCFKTLILSIYFIFMFDDFPKSARVCIKFPSHSLARSVSPSIYNVNALYLYRLHFSALHHIHLQTICWMCACESSRAHKAPECLLNSLFSLWLIFFETRKCISIEMHHHPNVALVSATGHLSLCWYKVGKTLFSSH